MMNLCDRSSLSGALPKLPPNPPSHLEADLESRPKQVHYQAIQTAFEQNLQAVRALNPRLFDRQFAELDLTSLQHKLLTGAEAEFKQELAIWCAAVNRFYADYKLIRLARINCRVQEAKWLLRRTTIACRLFPVLGLFVAAVFLHLQFDWLQAVAITGLVVMPLMLWITHSLKQEMKCRAKQDFDQRKRWLYDEWQRLDAQEMQVRDRCAALVQS